MPATASKAVKYKVFVKQNQSHKLGGKDLATKLKGTYLSSGFESAINGYYHEISTSEDLKKIEALPEVLFATINKVQASSEESWEWNFDYSNGDESDDDEIENESGSAKSLEEALSQISAKVSEIDGYKKDIKEVMLEDIGDEFVTDYITSKWNFNIMIIKPKASADLDDEFFTVYLKEEIAESVASSVKEKFGIEVGLVDDSAINVYTTDKNVRSSVINHIGNDKIVEVA